MPPLDLTEPASPWGGPAQTTTGSGSSRMPKRP